jgi:hypothetical protein
LITKNSHIFFHKAPFANSITIIGNFRQQISIFCNTSAYGSSPLVIWLQSIDKMNIIQVQNDSRITYSQNGQQLNFGNLSLSDQQYYACGVLTTKLTIVEQYFLFVRVYPIMVILYNNSEVNSNQTLVFNKNQIYQIVCSSVNSNPDVSLALYDTDSLIQLSNSVNSYLQSFNQSNLYTNILQVDLNFTGNTFDNIKSLTCLANSTNMQVPLVQMITRNTTLIVPTITTSTSTTAPPGNFFFNFYFFLESKSLY